MNNFTNFGFTADAARLRRPGRRLFLAGMILGLAMAPSRASGQVLVRNETDDRILVGVVSVYNDYVTMNGWYTLGPGEERQVDGNFFKAGRIWHFAVLDVSKNQALFKTDRSRSDARLSMKTADCWISNNQVNWRSEKNAFLAGKVATGDWEALKNTFDGLQKHRALRVRSTLDHWRCTVRIQPDGAVACDVGD